jgi:hypothetical protein
MAGVFDRWRKKPINSTTTLFYELERYKTYYRAKREDAIDPSTVNQTQRLLFGID